MARLLKTLSFERSSELSALVAQLIEERKPPLQDKIDALELPFPLVSYTSIANITSFCKVGVDPNLPEWLQTFLSHCVADANDQIAKTH